MEYQYFYCAECDEEYLFLEDQEECVICGCALELIE